MTDISCPLGVSVVKRFSVGQVVDRDLQVNQLAVNRDQLVMYGIARLEAFAEIGAKRFSASGRFVFIIEVLFRTETECQRVSQHSIAPVVRPVVRQSQYSRGFSAGL
ncbi:hypothetical protein WLU28_01065 [Bordetella bronchiseptica]